MHSSPASETYPTSRSSELPAVQRQRRQQAIRNRQAAIVMQAITARLAQAPFTRDDVLTVISTIRLGDEWTSLSGLNDTATATRYAKICTAIQHLLSAKKLIALNSIQLCLPELATRLDTSTPLHVSYQPTIHRIIQEIPYDTVVDVMYLVDRWRSDQHLPTNIKRMTIRLMLPKLLRSGWLRHSDIPNEYIVN